MKTAHSRSGFWLGGRRKCPSSCDSWEWVNLKPWTWTKWASGEPNSEEEECLEIYYREKSPFEGFFEWNDVQCSAKRKFLCKMTK